MNENTRARSQEIAYLRVEHDERTSLLVAPIGASLRAVLLANGISPYTALTERLNCGGRGLCATCGIRFVDPETLTNPGRIDPPPAPEHWHDRLGSRFGYPRLSCQITVDRDLALRIPEKLVWGGRETADTDES